MKHIVAVVLCLVFAASTVQAQGKPRKIFTPVFTTVWGGLTAAMLLDTYSTAQTSKCCPSCVEATPGVRAFIGHPVQMGIIGAAIDAGLMYSVHLMGRHWNPALRNIRYLAPLSLAGLHVQATINNFGICG